eukprot:jgi/Astpho2/8803/Aster-05446
MQFFFLEYTLNHLIAVYPKPYISLLDGIVMGGGAGVSMHGSFRVATEKSLFAMPECGIGLFVDIGAAFFLSRLPGELGMYLALTGQRLKGVQLREATLATHYMPSHLLPELESELQQLGTEASSRKAVHELLAKFEAREQPPQQTDLLVQLPDINGVFAHDSVEQIHQALEERGDAWAQQTLKLMHSGSPTSQKICFKHVRDARRQRLDQVLLADYRLAWHKCNGDADFVEGIRAKLIEKTGDPNWQPATVHEVRPLLKDGM